MKGFIRGVLAVVLGMILAHMGFSYDNSKEFWAIIIIYAIGSSL